MENKNYCMPEGIENEEQHLEYLKTIGVMTKEGIIKKDKESFKLFLYHIRRSGDSSPNLINLIDNLENCLDEGSVESIVDLMWYDTRIAETEKLLKILMTYILSNHYA